MSEIELTSKKETFRYKYSQVIFSYIFLIVFMIITGLFNNKFFYIRNLRYLIIGAFPLLMVAYGQTLVILTGAIDLSLGSILALTNCVCTVVMTKVNSPMDFLVAIIISLVVGAGCGLINGLACSKGRLPSIIVTIASTMIFSGAALLILKVPGGEVNKTFAKFFTSSIGIVPLAFILLILLAILVRYLTNATSFGKSLRSISNETITTQIGINVDRIKILVFVIAGVFAAIGGIFITAVMRSGDPTIGGNYSLNSVTATIIGGTLMTGVVGDVSGTIAGVFILSLINNMLNLIGVASYYQFIISGAILILALLINSIRTMRDN